MMRPFLFPLLALVLVAPLAYGAEEAKKEEGAAATPSATTAGVETARAFTATELELLQELDRKRVELDRRQQALELREKLVDLMETRLNERTSEMQQLKAQLEALMKNASGKEDEEIQQLALIYGNMKPQAAAVVLNRLDNAIVFDVIKRMPTKKSGKLMESLDPAKARIISEMMADPVVSLPAISATTP
jgi:flagellar motility protein MotE (MotC chaperone)